MKKVNIESYILYIIKYMPSLFLIILAILFTSYLSNEYFTDLQKQKENIKKEFIKSNNRIIQANIDDLVNNYINREIKNSKDKLKKTLKYYTNYAYKIMISIYEKYKDTKTKEEIIELIRTVLRPITFNDGRGYFFINDFNGTNIFHYLYPEREGKNILNLQDIKGVYIVKESIKLAKSKEKGGFKKWYFSKPNDDRKEHEKIGYIKRFEPYNWYIGTGEYIEDFEKEIKKDILSYLSTIRYDNGEYIYVLDLKGNILLSKENKLNGKNMFEIKNFDFNNSNIYLDFLNSSKETLIFDYKINNDIDKKYSKISYNRKIKNLSWIIGTGFNLDKVNILIEKEQLRLEEKYRNEMKILLILSILISAILLVISMLVSRYIKNRLLSYQNNLKRKNDILIKAQEIANLCEWEIDLKTNKIYSSSKSSEILGLNSKERFNFDTLKRYMHKDYWNEFYKDIQKSMKNKSEHNYIYELTRPCDGKNIWIESKGTISSRNTFLGVFQDITKLKDIELEAQKKNKLLYQQNKLAIMGEMINNIAHQWKQPLSSISVASTGMKIDKEMGTLSNEHFNNSIEVINSSTQYLSQTIDDFRNFFKVKKENFFYFNIANTIEKTLKLLESKFKMQNIKIVKNIEQVNIKSSENELIQVLMNILSNARDELLKYDYERIIFIRTFKKKNELFIEIKDNAKGIPDSIKEKIFDAYFTTKEHSDGTGIGLYMSKDIVTKLLKGDIFVENETYIYNNKQYSGAKFTIKLKI